MKEEERMTDQEFDGLIANVNERFGAFEKEMKDGGYLNTEQSLYTDRIWAKLHKWEVEGKRFIETVNEEIRLRLIQGVPETDLQLARLALKKAHVMSRPSMAHSKTKKSLATTLKSERQLEIDRVWGDRTTYGNKN